MNDRSHEDDTMPTFDRPLWTPDPARATATRMAAFTAYARPISGRALASYADLHAWSIDAPAQFWSAIWDFCGVRGERGERVLIDPQRMPGAHWFPDARLNFAENLLRDCGNPEALVFWGEDRVKRRLSRLELRRQVAQFAAALKEIGIGAGDRVAAYLPNLPETIVAMLAAASIGAVFTSASPDFGVQGVLDRFGQTEPKVLIACDGYWYNGKAIDIEAKLAELMPQLPSARRTDPGALLGRGDGRAGGAVAQRRFLTPASSRPTRRRSRTSRRCRSSIRSTSCIRRGRPACPNASSMARGHLLQHLKEHQLHTDVREGDRLFYFTTCGWMMWNWLASGLASGATLLLYDGNPFVARGRILWDYAQAERMSHFGTSAKYLDALIKTGLKPKEEYDLSPLRVMTSTGSPLAPERFDEVYAHIKSDLQLASISGGTDMLSCFVLGNPTVAGLARRDSMQGPGAWRSMCGTIRANPSGARRANWSVPGRFRRMPVGFWNDPDGKKYRAAYFERFPGVWHHGDFCEITGHDGLIIHGRSDATLNPGGVRIGTAEIYRQVEKLPEVAEALVIGQDWEGDVRVVLFVKFRQA
jgi:acetoacetyl-CoA synthetase